MMGPEGWRGVLLLNGQWVGAGLRVIVFMKEHKSGKWYCEGCALSVCLCSNNGLAPQLLFLLSRALSKASQVMSGNGIWPDIVLQCFA
jgi:hypothetical protein